MDTFDYKPELIKAEGKLTKAGGGLSNQEKPLVKPRWEFRPGGECGTMVSDLFPHVRECMDDIAIINSMKSDDNEHSSVAPSEVACIPVRRHLDFVVDYHIVPCHALRPVQPKLLLIKRSRHAAQRHDTLGNVNLQPHHGLRVGGKLPANQVFELLIGFFRVASGAGNRGNHEDLEKMSLGREEKGIPCNCYASDQNIKQP